MMPEYKSVGINHILVTKFNFSSQWVWLGEDKEGNYSAEGGPFDSRIEAIEDAKEQGVKKIFVELIG